MKGRRDEIAWQSIFNKRLLRFAPSIYVHLYNIRVRFFVRLITHSLSLSLYCGSKRMKRQCTRSGGSPANSQKERFATLSSHPPEEKKNNHRKKNSHTAPPPFIPRERNCMTPEWIIVMLRSKTMAKLEGCIHSRSVWGDRTSEQTVRGRIEAVADS